VAGAPADVFISANEGWVDRMQKAGLAMPGTRRSILSNTLVIVARAGYDRPLRSARDLTNAASLALAQPDTVPAGIYARRYLQKLGLWKTLKPKVIPAENVRAALAAVEAGNADAAIVYKTDAIIAKNLKIAVEVPAAEGPKISYAMAVVRQTAHPSGAKRFAACLLSPAAQTVFERYGFTVPVEKR
ncbi:MAG: molybdate ABC transporter substrate-binding protein, partial [Verrucomicrobia bacterium]|nr:molybdate ABC transporter substrate-binding protein [Verrucomicrobiota bacterium]